MSLLLLTCIKDKNKILNNHSGLDQSIKIDKVENYAVINCGLADCYELPTECYCNNSNCCTRQDLDPCDYANGEEFAQSVACEYIKLPMAVLNRALNMVVLHKIGRFV